jgi:branched-chain amino acid transport system ATP-binding protein
VKLSLENVTKNFGGLRAASDVSFSVSDKVIFGLIGPNGAGKTTVFNLITGIYKPDRGRIRFGGSDLGPLKPAQISAIGIGRTFQNIRLFGQLTVIENLLVACEQQKKAHLAAAVLRLASHYLDEQTMRARALELLRVFDLHTMADDAPTSLSYGNQRRLEIARAMMSKPKLLLLDEPAAGMNYGEAEGLKTQIRWLRDTFDLSIVLVEHNMQVVMGVCEEIHVLDHGETIASGPPARIRTDAKVIAAYLGEEETDAASVRAVAEELSKPDVASLVPPSRPDLTSRSVDKREPSSNEAQGLLQLANEISPASEEPMPLGRLEDLSKELVKSLEKGLPRPDEDEALPEVPLPDRSSGNLKLNNVDRGWSSGRVPNASESSPDIDKGDVVKGKP